LSTRFSPSLHCAPVSTTQACHRTLRWLDRCIAANKHPEKQNLFGIVQGGLDTAPGGLRDVNLDGMVARDLPG